MSAKGSPRSDDQMASESRGRDRDRGQTAVEYLRTIKDTLRSLSTATTGGPAARGMIEASGVDIQLVHDLLAESLREARCLLNATRPIMRLPPEILCRIFEMTQVDFNKLRDPGRSPTRRTQHSPLAFSWLAIMSVCRHWNTVAKSCSSLWTTILMDTWPPGARMGATMDTPSPNYELFLPRSGSLPLDVALDFELTGPDLAQDILSHLPRMRSLYVTRFFTRDDAQWMCRSAPQLRVLSLGSMYTDSETEDDEDDDSEDAGPPLPDLFAGDLSLLLSLSIGNVGNRLIIDAYSKFDHLRQLRLHCVELSNERIAREVASALTHMRNLEDLRLSWLIVVEAKQGQIPRTMLPRLQRLCLEHPCSCAAALRLLCIPSGVMLSILVSFYNDNEMLPSDCSWLGDLAELKSVKLRLVTLSDGTAACRAFALGKQSALQIRCSPEGSPGGTRSDVPLICDTMGTVETLWIDGVGPLEWTPKALVDILRPMTGLQTVILNVTDARVLAMCLKVFIAQVDGECHYPHLHTLYLRDPPQTVHSDLREVLQTRMQHGCRVKTVYVKHHDKDASSIAQTRDRTWWRNVGHIDLRSLVDELVFMDEELPRMEPLSICNSPSTGAWQWPVWEDV